MEAGENQYGEFVRICLDLTREGGSRLEFDTLASLKDENGRTIIDIQFGERKIRYYTNDLPPELDEFVHSSHWEGYSISFFPRDEVELE